MENADNEIDDLLMKNILFQRYEGLRSEMEILGAELGLHYPAVLKISQKLDQLQNKLVKLREG
ncbi:aspartyl-phosphate phosphatase Spo0E family protein [Paenibacillus andongensis]|uniref:aspartyl-phosphate phosphatase Spo0E family protein n=1 Tax=Paenibacillus andongensis TaxID=2975482 RepID=UPI0021BA7883|nr:aspartyl-phosphate phosphatase Spo0E family protein [Paenibacillus andongensis]